MMEEKIYVHGYLQLQEIHILHIVSGENLCGMGASNGAGRYSDGVY